jgi:hypothetical protein
MPLAALKYINSVKTAVMQVENGKIIL